MVNSSTPQDGEDSTRRLPSSLDRDERQPLLSQAGVTYHVPPISNDGETEINEDVTVGVASMVRQICTAKQSAVMICFFMNGLCTTAIGVRGLSAALHLNKADLTRP